MISKKPIVVSVLIIALGIAWLLNTLHVIPGVDWVWTLGLGISGVLVVAAGGLNKLTFVVGPFLIIASVLSVLRQTGVLRADIEVPVLVILLISAELRQRLERLVADAAERRRIGERSRAYAEKIHDLELVADRLLALYSRL